MKYNKNRRIMLSLYLAASSATLLTGFTSLAAETDKSIFLPKTGHAMYAEWDFSDIPQEIHTEILRKQRMLPRRHRMHILKRRNRKEKRLRRQSVLRKSRLQEKQPHRQRRSCLHP